MHACMHTGTTEGKTGENTNSSAKKSSEESVQRSPGPPQAYIKAPRLKKTLELSFEKEQISFKGFAF